jgi:polysaccharide biosynthesis/export protein
MRTLCARFGPRQNRSERAPRGGRKRALVLAAIVIGFCGAGCTLTEARFTPKDLPANLQATRWQAPCTVDLSPGRSALMTAHFEAGDEVEVLVASGLNASQMTRFQTTVATDGTVELPILGRIPVAGEGVTPETSRQAVVQACYREGVTQKPLVNVSLKKPRQNQIIVNGAVSHPGVYTLSRDNSDLVSALAAAGGLSREAGEKIVIQSRPKGIRGPQQGGPIVRIGGTADQLDPPSLIADSNSPGDRREIRLPLSTKEKLASEELKDGDVLVVERRDPPGIVVTGMVNKPGRYDLPINQEFRILDAVATAHGVSYKVLDRVMVCRAVPGKAERAVIEVSLREATRNQQENLLLVPGDIVSVEANMPVLFQDCVDFIISATLGVGPAVIK